MPSESAPREARFKEMTKLQYEKEFSPLEQAEFDLLSAEVTNWYCRQPHPLTPTRIVKLRLRYELEQERAK